MVEDNLSNTEKPPTQLVSDLIDRVIATESRRLAPEKKMATSVFYLEHGTNLNPVDQPVVYRNRYALVRIGTSFGACAFEGAYSGPSPDKVAQYSGLPVLDLLAPHIPASIRMAALDGWLADSLPHRDDSRVTIATLPTGTPLERALFRARIIVDLVDPHPGQKVMVIGVVTPIVEQILAHGAIPILCDRNQDECLGIPVHHDMSAVLPGLTSTDAVLATGMTILDGSFDVLRRSCLGVGASLTIHAQSGSAVVREFVGNGVTGLSAEHFPFSQFSADATPLYVYRESDHA